jgi:tripartite-type tricarboxylate transporter receptor subunit TctC
MADWQEELGYDVNDLRTLGSTHFNALMVRSDTPDDVYAKLVEAFKQTVEDPEWREQVKDYRFPIYIGPEEAQATYDNMREGIERMTTKTN